MSGDTLVYFWRREVSLESVRATRQAVDVARAVHPGGLYVLACVAQGTAMPTSEVREESAIIDRYTGPFLRAHATVIPGEGFWVASARSVLGAVFFLSRTSYPRRVFRDAAPALIWLRASGGCHAFDALVAHVRGQQEFMLPAQS